jgi:hypothetical protein
MALTPSGTGCHFFRFDRWRLMPGKRVQFDDETWQAVDLLARDRMMAFQESYRAVIQMKQAPPVQKLRLNTSSR